MEFSTNDGPTRGRIEWKELRERIDLAAVATALMGPAPGRRGEGSRRLWWRCPFHEDGNPSFCIDPGNAWWRCFGCHERGDAATLVMRLRSMTFPETVRWLADQAGGMAPPITPRSKSRPGPEVVPKPGAGPEGMTVPEAEALVERAADRLWGPEGADALDGLRGRGLADETIRDARLGFDPNIRATTRDGRAYTARGIVIPWMESGRLSLVKARQPEGRRPKYAEVYRDQPGLYVAAPIVPGRPAIATEGELDALLVAQETAAWRCGVVTTGSAANRPDARIAGRLLCAWPWIVATDADEAGDKAASAWMELAPARCRRARPSGPGKDWSDAYAAGWGRIAYHLAPLLMPSPSWEGLSAERWAEPTDDDEPPGILTDS